MKKHCLFVSIAAAIFLFLAGQLLFPNVISAADGDHIWGWNNSAEVCATQVPSHYEVISDENGGAIIVWMDGVSFGSSITYVKAQRLDANGNKLWTPTPVYVSLNNKAKYPAIAPDGAGGVIVAFEAEDVSGNEKIYAQRLNSSGVRQWPSDAVMSSTLTSEFAPIICSDNAGGAYIGWYDRLTTINSSGTVTSGVDGIQACPGALLYSIVNDGLFPVEWNGHQWVSVPTGAYVAWTDYSSPPYPLKVQRIGAGLEWGTGITVASHDIGVFKSDANLSNDGSGGLLVTWFGLNNPSASELSGRVQRFNSSGIPQWSAGGVEFVNSITVGADYVQWANFGTIPVVANDGSGGAIVAWQDFRNWGSPPSVTGDDDVYAQRIDAGGSISWGGGILLPPIIVGSTAPGSQRGPSIASDGVGGAIVTYMDMGDSWEISATRLYSDGTKLWARIVRDDCLNPGDPCEDQEYPVITFDASGSSPIGAVIVWDDFGDNKLYAQKVEIDQSPPANDACSNAVVVTNGQYEGSLIRATNDGSANCGSSLTNPDVWYRFVAPSIGTLDVNTCGTHDMGGQDSGVDTVLSFHSACIGTTANELECNDDWPSGSDSTACSGTDAGGTRDSAISFSVNNGQSILIRVSKYGTTHSGNFVLNVAFTPDSAADVNISFSLQGSNRPDPAGWLVPVTVKYFSPGADVMNDTPLYTFNLNTTKPGSYAVCQCTGVATGTYDITAVSEHTLTNVIKNVLISAPSTGVHLDDLLEGDCDNDGIIGLPDFNILKQDYFGPSTQADFDRDGTVGLPDFNLFKENYFKTSPIEVY